MTPENLLISSHNFFKKNSLSEKKTVSRFIELDILRGIAIVLMIFLHILWDLDYFGILALNSTLYQIQFICPTLFLILVGICLSISYNKKYDPNNYDIHKYFIKRGLKIFSLGILLTVVTMIFISDRPIFFGVLHCIGISIILSIFFLRFKTYNFILASIIILAGILIGGINFSNPSILHLIFGIHQSNIWSTTIDYFPIIPWFGLTLLGIALGNILYKDNIRQFHSPNLSKYKPVMLVSWLGKNSLIIYLVHQPIIAATLSVLILL